MTSPLEALCGVDSAEQRQVVPVNHWITALGDASEAETQGNGRQEMTSSLLASCTAGPEEPH